LRGDRGKQVRIEAVAAAALSIWEANATPVLASREATGSRLMASLYPRDRRV